MEDNGLQVPGGTNNSPVLDSLGGEISPLITLDAAENINPAAAAEASSIAASEGISEALAFDGLKEIKKERLARYIQQNTRYSNWVTESDINAALAKDDPEALGNLFQKISTRESILRAEQPRLRQYRPGFFESSGKALSQGAGLLGDSIIGISLLVAENLEQDDYANRQRKRLKEREEHRGPPIHEMPNSSSFQLYLECLSQVPQLAGTAVATCAGGPVAGLAFVGGETLGSTYNELREADVNASEAALFAGINAVTAIALERYVPKGIQRVWKPAPGKVLNTMARGVVQDGVTEFLQAFSDDLTTELATGDSLGQGFDNFLNNIDKTIDKGSHAALLSLPFSIYGGAGKVGYDKARARKAKNYAQAELELNEAVNQTKLKDASSVKMEGLLEQNGMGQEVYTDAATLLQSGVPLVALGLDLLNLREAAALGQDVTVKRSALHANLAPEQFKEIMAVTRETPESLTLQESELVNRVVDETLESLIELNEEQQNSDLLFKNALEEMKQSLNARINENITLKSQAQALAGSVNAYSNNLVNLWSAFARRMATTDQERAEMLRRVALRNGVARPDGALMQGATPGRDASVVQIDSSKIPVQLKNTRALTKWLQKQYQGREIAIADDGTVQQYTRKGLESSTKRRGDEQRSIYAELDKLLENALFDGFEAADSRHKHLRGQNIYYSAANIGGKLYAVRFKVDIPTGENKNPTYKDHRVSEIEIVPALYAEPNVSNDISGDLPAALTEANPSTISAISIDVLKGLVNPSRIEANTLYQGERGSLVIDKNTYTINISPNADLSTLVHESAYIFLEEARRLVESDMADQTLARDIETAERWMREGSEKEAHKIAKERGISIEAAREIAAQERFARGFAAYLLEGKAPSNELISVFEHFRHWLKTIYKSTVILGVQLNNEICGVFDRMLLTELEIEQAAARNNLYGLTDEAMKKMGMTKPERIYANELLNAAKVKTEAQIDAAVTKELAVLKSQWAKSVEEAANLMPEYQARGELHKRSKGNQAANQLNLAGLQAYIGKEKTKEFARKVGPGSVSWNGELDPAVFAARFGFKDVAEMADRLSSVQSKSEWQEDTVNLLTSSYRLFQDVETELLKKKEVKEHLDFVGKYLAQATGRRVIGNDAIEQVAGNRLRDMPLGQAVQSKRFEAEMRRALAKERKNIATGDFEAAFTANQQARFNLEFARGARNIAAQVNKTMRAAKRFVNMKSADPDARYLVQDIGVRFGLVAADEGLAQSRTPETAQRWINERLEEGAVLYMSDITTSGSAVDNKSLSMNQFEIVADNIAQVITTERNMRKFVAAQVKEDFAAAIDKAVETITSNVKAKPQKRFEEPNLVRKAVDYIAAAHTKVETNLITLDGGPAGYLHSLVYKPLSEADIKRGRMWQELQEHLESKEVFGRYTAKEINEFAQRKYYVKELGESVTHEKMLMMALNMGNSSNLDRLLTGLNLTQEQLDAAMTNMEQRDWDFVQAIWNTFEGYQKEAFELQEKMAGIQPVKVEARPVKTEYGDYKGGYFPIVYDPEKARPDFSEKLMNATSPTFAMTTPGHLKERSSRGSGTPLKLQLSVINGGLKDVITDIAFRPAYADVAKVIRNDKFRSAVEGTMGRETYRDFVDWLKDAPGERAATQQYGTPLKWVRTSATQMSMGFKITTLLNQPLGLSQSIELLGYKHVASSIREVYGRGVEQTINMLAWVREASPEMAQRQGNCDRDAAEAMGYMDDKSFSPGNILDAVTPAALLELERKFKKYGLPLIGKMQYYTVDVPTWVAAYNKGLVDFNSDKTQARDYADSAVRLSQGSGRSIDLAKVQRGGELAKALTMFYSYFNTIYNLTVLRTRDVNMKRDLNSVVRAANTFLLLYIVPSIFGELLAGRGPDEDEDAATWAAKQVINYPMQTVVGLRTFASVIEGYGYKATPASDTPDSIACLMLSLNSAIFNPNTEFEAKKFARNTLRAYGYAKGLPLGQVEISVFNIVDYLSGTDEDLELRDLFFRKPKSRR